MKLSIIIVTWNVEKDLIQCLNSLQKNSPDRDYEVIVVDNASTDGTCEQVKTLFPKAFLIENKQNRGFAAANNQGIEIARGQYLLLLNPDTIVHPGALNGLIAFLDENPDVGACGPKLLYADGSVQFSVRRFPTFRAAMYRYTALRFLAVFRKDYKRWRMKDFQFDLTCDADQIMGAALMVRKSVIDEVGPLDERFFMYYEEVDWCYRIRQAGYRIVYYPKTVITHLGGRSAKKVPVGRRVMAMTSLIKFFRKHRGKFTTSLFVVVFKAGVILDNILSIIFSSIALLFFSVTFQKKPLKRALRILSSSLELIFRYSGKILWQI